MSKASEQTPSNDQPADTWQCPNCGVTGLGEGHAPNCPTKNYPFDKQQAKRRSSAKEFSVVVGRCLRALRELKSPVQQRLALEFIIDDLKLPKPDGPACNLPPLG